MPQSEDKHSKLRSALRANLKKRKSQSRKLGEADAIPKMKLRGRGFEAKATGEKLSAEDKE